MPHDLMGWALLFDTGRQSTRLNRLHHVIPEAQLKLDWRLLEFIMSFPWLQVSGKTCYCRTDDRKILTQLMTAHEQN